MSKRTASLMVSAANALSVSRLCAVPAIVYLVSRSVEVESYRLAAFWLVACLHAGDVLDGYLGRKGSRRLAVRNHFGEMIDPFADKTYIGAALITLAVMDQFAAWFVLLAIARDVSIVVGWTAVYKQYGVRILPNKVGKLTDGCLALVIGVVLLRLDPATIAFLTYFTAGLIVYSAYTYARAATRAVYAAKFRQLRFAAARRKRVGIARGGVGRPAS